MKDLDQVTFRLLALAFLRRLVLAAEDQHQNVVHVQRVGGDLDQRKHKAAGEQLSQKRFRDRRVGVRRQQVGHGELDQIANELDLFVSRFDVLADQAVLLVASEHALLDELLRLRLALALQKRLKVLDQQRYQFVVDDSVQIQAGQPSQQRAGQVLEQKAHFALEAFIVLLELLYLVIPAKNVELQDGLEQIAQRFVDRPIDQQTFMWLQIDARLGTMPVAGQLAADQARIGRRRLVDVRLEVAFY